MMPSDPFSALTFITGPAILTNACAILQNGVNIRYNLAITQWRDFRASVAARDDRLALLFIDPTQALRLAERRVHLQLRALDLLNAAAALFGGATVGGLVGAFLIHTLSVPTEWIRLIMIVATGAALAVILWAFWTLSLESACGRSMVRLHRSSPPPARSTEPASTPASERT
jgi:hypothetical protein